MQQSIEHIVSDPNTAFGKPRIEGTRFSVKDVVIHHFFNRMPLEIIAAKWDLPVAGVYAAIAYYYDHREQIDKSIADDDEYVRMMKEITPSLLEPNRHLGRGHAR
ncbi:MAG TPA: DUF433 domain-containing protein [Candidatus Kapabacteria bacterium]|jgi:uncharacterized protein (DUF433 family)|nr:DUF433 domain-containing protein [Candidatus Kapabacteria bacterium]